MSMMAKKEISEHDKRMLTLLHAWAKLRKYWKTRTFQGEVDFHLLQSCREKNQQQKEAYNTPACDFDIKHVKEEEHSSWEELSSISPYSLNVRANSPMTYLTNEKHVYRRSCIS